MDHPKASGRTPKGRTSDIQVKGQLRCNGFNKNHPCFPRKLLAPRQGPEVTSFSTDSIHSWQLTAGKRHTGDQLDACDF